MSILIFFIVLFLLILVHEWGHFIVAKKTGMRVDEFGIGFPPKLFGWKRGETEYTLNALPIGGFVRIYGENAEDAALDSETGADTSRAFTSRSRLAQALVLVAGVTMNVIFAWFLLVAAFMIGVPSGVTGDEVPAGTDLLVQSVVAESPAAAAGLTPRTVITGLATEDAQLKTLTPAAFSAFVAEAGTVPLVLSFENGDEVEEVMITPRTDLAVGDEAQPLIGVSLALVEMRQYGLFAAMGVASVETWNMLGAITIGIASLLTDAVMGQADFSSVAGPVGIVGMVGDAASFGLTPLLFFTAIISLNLAIINLLPIPALDGGRLVIVGIEAVRRRAINPAWVARANFIGFILLMLLMVVVTYNDVLRML